MLFIVAHYPREACNASSERDAKLAAATLPPHDERADYMLLFLRRRRESCQ